MKKDEIDNTQLIAEFMKIKNIFPFITKDDEFLGMYISDDEDGSIDYKYGINWLNYKDWKTIMLVVENIENLFETDTKKESVDITSHYIRYSHHNEKCECEFNIVVGCFLESPEEIKVESKLDAVYLVVSEIIKWYNNYNK